MKTKLLGVVAALVLALSIGAAKADTFNVSGTLSDGGILSGILTIDASGTPTGVSNLRVTQGLYGADLNYSASFVIPPPQFLPDPDIVVGPGSLSINNGLSNYVPFTKLSLSLTFSLTNFLSGNLSNILSGSIFWPNSCDFVGQQIVCAGEGAAPHIVSGSLTPIPTVPLPATLPLFATGLGALGLLGWRRKRKAAAHDPE
jgi:hypothetical protein